MESLNCESLFEDPLLNELIDETVKRVSPFIEVVRTDVIELVEDMIQLGVFASEYGRGSRYVCPHIVHHFRHELSTVQIIRKIRIQNESLSVRGSKEEQLARIKEELRQKLNSQFTDEDSTS